MKVIAGSIAGFMIAASLSVATAPAQAADPYTPKVRTFADTTPLKAKPRRARIKLRVTTNGAGSPPAKVIITIRGPKGKVLRQVTRNYTGPNTTYFFQNLPPRRLSFSFIIIPKNGKRFHETTSRTVIKVTPLKKKKR